jgi:hypothetical protein
MDLKSGALTAAGEIVLIGPTVIFSGTLSATNSRLQFNTGSSITGGFNSPSGFVEIKPLTANRSLVVGATGAGTTLLTSAQLGRVTATTLMVLTLWRGAHGYQKARAPQPTLSVMPMSQTPTMNSGY